MTRHSEHSIPAWLAALAWGRASFWLIGLVAALLRVLDLGRYVTIDERNYWMLVSEDFLRAVQAGDFAATAITSHPAVTTMWLGSAGVLLRRGLVALGIIDYAPFPLLLALMQLPVALVNVAGILLGYALLRRLLPLPLAALAALLWATDPLLVAFSRVLHMDSLAGTFMTLSLLAALLAFPARPAHPRPAWALLALSAACAALALLSKVIGLAVLPVVALAWLWWLLRLPGGWRAGLPGALVAGLAWLAVFVLTLLLVWPAIWADPPAVAALMVDSVAEEGGQAHGWGNFFLGERNDAPGPLFYPVALALRLMPWTLAGLLLLPLAWRGWARAGWSDERRTLLLLLLFALLFIAVMSVFPKKFNRYLVPVFPALDVLAAVGLGWLLAQARRVWRPVLAGGLVLATLANAAYWHPYPIAAFNPLLGGARAGAYAFAVGWGEGLDQVADWLNAQPDITGVTTASTMVNSLQPYLRDGAQAVGPPGPELPPNTGYVVVYVGSSQRGMLWAPFDQFYPQRTPLHTVFVKGVPYAWIYQVPPPVEQQLDVTFGAALELRGATLETGALRGSGVLSLTLQWQAQASLPADYLLFAHLLTPDGQRVAQTDAPPAGPRPTSIWPPRRAETWTHPLPVPADLPPGPYWLALGVYDPQDGVRLPVDTPPPPGAPDAGGNALLLPVQVAP